MNKCDKSMQGTVHDEGLRRRDRLQRHAARLLNEKVPRIDRYGQERAHYVYRVAMCQRGTDGSGDIELKRSPDHNRSQYFGLQTCASPWSCPVCAPKIAAEQVKEMNLAISRWLNGWNDEGGRVYFVTLTNQHGKERAGQGECKADVQRLAKALSYYKGTRVYREFMSDVAGMKGEIRALETTYGEMNGWHHHTHSILFARSGLLVSDRQGQPVRWLSPLWKLRKHWARVLIKHGMSGLEKGDIGLEKFRKLRNLLRRCFDVQSGAYAAEYVAKFGREPEADRGSWGMASELAKSHLKTGVYVEGMPRRCEHAGPWALLNDALDGDARSGELFSEFSKAFHGRAKLFWSPKLKGFFGINEKTDEEIARAPDELCTEHVMLLSAEQWRLVLAHDKRFDVRRAAAIEGREGVERLLSELRQLKPTHSGEFSASRSPPGFISYTTLNGDKAFYTGDR